MTQSPSLQDFTLEFRLGKDVDAADTSVLFDLIVGTRDQLALQELLGAWNEKGFSDTELFNFAKLMRSRMVRVETDRSPLIDIVGTGGTGAKTFNVSTAAAFIAAGCGIAVAKHGNRAATSLSGSADALTELGVEIEAQPEHLASRLRRDGICFLFAPNHHALSPTLAAARQELGKPTIFNCLGPLCNPASPTHSVIGVARREWVMPVASALAHLGTKRSWVVFGEGGIDEIALAGQTIVAEVAGSRVLTSTVSAEDFTGRPLPGEPPRGCTAAESAAIIESILSGGAKDTPIERIALINAASAVYVSGFTESLQEAYLQAHESVQTGRAALKLNCLRRKRT
jgi:anthranilate phosphoribosyltransferase